MRACFRSRCGIGSLGRLVGSEEATGGRVGRCCYRSAYVRDMLGCIIGWGWGSAPSAEGHLGVSFCSGVMAVSGGPEADYVVLPSYICM
jgi:hypothetical protein